MLTPPGPTREHRYLFVAIPPSNNRPETCFSTGERDVGLDSEKGLACTLTSNRREGCPCRRSYRARNAAVLPRMTWPGSRHSGHLPLCLRCKWELLTPSSSCQATALHRSVVQSAGRTCGSLRRGRGHPTTAMWDAHQELRHFVGSLSPPVRVHCAIR